MWQRQYDKYEDAYLQIFENALSQNPESNVEFLEKNVKKVAQREYAVACNSATDALMFSLVANDIGPGDEVLVTNFSWISTASCIAMAGATPVFCDIDFDTRHISIDSIKRMQSPKVKAIIYTHLFGSMSDTTEIEQWCKESNVLFIEDAAQSIGSSYNGKVAGSIGDCSSYSFNANKVISGISGGGMFMTDSKEMAEKVKKLRKHGKDDRDGYITLGVNSKMYVLNAMMIDFRLKQLESERERRKEIAMIYDSILDQTHEQPGLIHNYHKYTYLTDKRNLLDLQIHYDRPLSAHPMWQGIHHRADDTPNAREVSQKIVSLPIDAFMTDNEAKDVATKIYKTVE